MIIIWKCVILEMSDNKSNIIKKIPNIIVISRAISFLILLIDILDNLKIEEKNQKRIYTFIVTGDILDGIISRKYNNKEGKEKFRILDSSVDSFGILSALFLLKKKGLIDDSLFKTNIIYKLITNLYVLINKEKGKLDSTLISRAFTLYEAYLIYNFKNNKFSEENINFHKKISKIFSAASLTSHSFSKIKNKN